MRYLKPDFYDRFACTADQCPDTCCAGWQIMIDEASLEKYEQVPGSFGSRLKNSIDWEEGSFYQYDRRCAFLNEQNLCDLYLALGEEGFCETCRNYPRHTEEFEGLREMSLSLSCPVAAKLILSQQIMPQFVSIEDDREDELEEEFADFDLLLFTQLEDARNAVFDTLRKKDACLQDNMERALWLADRMQKCLEQGNFFEIEEAIAQYRSGTDGTCSKKAADCYTEKYELYQTMVKLERLREEWSDVLAQTEQILYSSGEDGYVQIQEEFSSWINREPEERARWENIGLQLFVFFLYTYFCGAVYDDWIYSKMALSVCSVAFIRELLLARWKKTGTLTFEDYVELSYRYAREIEHSDQNLNELEEIFMEKEG